VVLQVIDRMRRFAITHQLIIRTKVENGLPERQGF
jgi:hypothetical protein